MLYRSITERIEQFFEKEKKAALMVTGARQVGKTYCIREYAKQHFKYVIEINFLEMPQAVALFENATGSDDILMRISALTDIPMEKDRTMIFFDEVQECREIVTAIKFLVEEGSYRYILSGSLLGVELKDIRSVPVGYMSIYEMFPMDFFEFCKANRVSEKVLDKLKNCFEEKIPVDGLIHDRMMDLFRLYLIVGGMPAAVQRYLDTNNLNEVMQVQKGIIQLYKKDIARYDPEHKLYLEEIFQLIPSELNSKNKRFILKNLNENFKFSRYEHSFIWLKEAGVALPVYCVQESQVPLLLSKQGELDFVIEFEGEALPLEVKSGKDYTKHRALNHVLESPNYHIQNAIVFCNENIEVKDQIFYCPIYMAGFLEKRTVPEDYIYTLDLSVLQD